MSIRTNITFSLFNNSIIYFHIKKSIVNIFDTLFLFTDKQILMIIY